MPTSVIPSTLDHRQRRGEQLPRRLEDRAGVGGRARERVRAGRAREVVEAQPQHDRAADAPRGSHPSGDALDEADRDGVDLGR